MLESCDVLLECTGTAVRIAKYPGHRPIGLLYGGIVCRPVKRGDVLALDDVDVPDSPALIAWTEVESRAPGAPLCHAGAAE